MGTTSTVKIMRNESVPKVVKTIKRWEDHNIFEREVLAINMLKQFDWCPKIIKINAEEKQIIMSYAGSPMNAKNVPEDALDQANQILLDLASVKVRHNDIKEEEVLVHDGKVCLCDFGWASLEDDFSFGDSEISSEEKPHGIIDDKAIIDICSRYLSKRKENE